MHPTTQAHSQDVATDRAAQPPALPKFRFRPAPRPERRAFGIVRVVSLCASILVCLSPATPAIAEIESAYDVVVAGAGTGGTCAAIQAARMGASVLLLEETDWIGGQMNAAAVTSMDEGGVLVRERGIYQEFVGRVEAHYAKLGKTAETAYMMRHICCEPRVGRQILTAMLDEARKTAPLDLALRSAVTQVSKQGNTITGVTVQSGADSRKVACKILIDATEWGDVIPLTGARYRVGNCTNDAIDPSRGIQMLTWTAVIKEYPKGVPPPLLLTQEPPGYTPKVHQAFTKTLIAGDALQSNPFDSTSRPWNFVTFLMYRGMPDSTTPDDAPPITRTHMNYNNDYPVRIQDVEDPASRLKTLRSAQLKTLHLLYYIQHTLGKTAWSVADDEGYDSPHRLAELDAWLKDAPELAPFRPVLAHFSTMAYARESRRIIGLHTLTAREIERKTGTPVQFPSAVALGDYPIDLHGSMVEKLLEMDLDRPEDIPSEFSKHGSGPFAIPMECFIPETLDGFLAAEKNISQSRLANGATRLQPSTMLMGQAAGAMAALSLQFGVPTRQLDPVLVQQVLLEAGAPLFITPLRDLSKESPEWKAVQLTATHGMLTPVAGKFGPDQAVSAEQFAGIRKLLGATDDGSATDPVTRAAFAAALPAGAVQVDFASSEADKKRPITRSEAAQVLADYLHRQAMAKMTGKPQTLAWHSVLPATPPLLVVAAALRRELQRLVDRKIIDSPDYWIEHAVEGQTCDGAKVAALIAEGIRALDPAATADNPAEVLARLGIVSRPEYWAEHAKPGAQCSGVATATLIGNLSRLLARKRG